MLGPILATVLATLLQIPAPPRLLDCGAGAVRARHIVAQADSAARRHDWRTADLLLEGGLRALGAAYRQPAIIDDSDLHLVLARMATRKGEFARAVTIRRRTLLDRLRLCTR